METEIGRYLAVGVLSLFTTALEKLRGLERSPQPHLHLVLVWRSACLSMLQRKAIAVCGMFLRLEKSSELLSSLSRKLFELDWFVCIATNDLEVPLMKG